MLKPRWVLLSVFFGVLAIAGCSSGDEARCVLGESPAEVCITGSNNNLEIKASGLEPGSQLVLETQKTGEGSYVVGAGGAPDGVIGLLGDLGGETISISATSESGAPFEGEVTIAG